MTFDHGAFMKKIMATVREALDTVGLTDAPIGKEAVMELAIGMLVGAGYSESEVHEGVVDIFQLSKEVGVAEAVQGVQEDMRGPNKELSRSVNDDATWQEARRREGPRPVNLKYPQGNAAFEDEPLPGDTERLMRLRSLIDDELGWNTPEDEDRGDYEERIREVGRELRLAKARLQ